MRRIPQSLARIVGIWAGLFATLSQPGTSLAQSVVTECTHAELATRIAEARDTLAGDGLVTFDCDGTIVLTNTIVLPFSLIEIEMYGNDSITNETELLSTLTLDGTGRFITISGPTVTNATATNGVRLFLVDSDVTLIVTNINFVNGQSTNGAAIYVSTNAELMAFGCAFSNNVAITTNGLDGVNPRTNTVAGVAKDGPSGKPSGTAAGGAIYNLGTAQFVQCSFLTNAAISGNGGLGGNGGNGTVSGGDGGNGGRAGQALGGAIYNQKDLSIFNCRFFSNFAGGGSAADGGAAGTGPFIGLSGHGGTGGSTAGGAIHNHLKSRAFITNSTFAFNAAASGNSSAGGGNNGRGKKGPLGPHSAGGAIANLGTNVLINCSFFANTVVGGAGGDGGPGTVQGGNGGSGGSAYGGNVFNGGKRGLLLATNCTFADGGATPGTNGLAGSGPVAAKNGVHGASRGGNLSNSNGVFYLKNCVIAYASPGTNGFGAFRDGGFNLSSDRSIKLNTRLGSITNKDPRLDVLRANGGPVETMELLSGSPAIDAGDTNFVLTVDARGVARPIGPRGDIGAYEAGVVLGPPRIVTQPVNQIAREDARIVFSVVAQGDPPLVYQWRKDGDDLLGETSDTLILEPITDLDEGAYEVVVSNNSGSVTSASANLDVVHAPLIVDDLLSSTNSTGVDFTLTVSAEGDEPLTYQWYRDGQIILGATLSTLIVADPQATVEYYVIVRNPYGEAVSSTARITVIQTPPVILVQPADLVVGVSNLVEITVGTGGSVPQYYQWYFNDTNLVSGQTNATLRILSARGTNEGLYHVVVTNQAGSVTSSNATLIVQTSKPTIVSPPADTTVPAGANATFAVVAGGSAPFGYQWYFNTNTLITGATNSVLVVTNAQSGNVGFYGVIVTNFLGSVTSAPAALTVQASPPVIQTNPASVTAYTGESPSLSVAAIGTGPLLYQWYFNSNIILGATNAVYTLYNVQFANAGTYSVTVTNGFGSVTSAPITLTVSNSAPIITEQPADFDSVDIDTSVTLSVTVVGSLPLAYQWYQYGLTYDPTNDITSVTSTNRLLGATNATLTFTNIQPEDAAIEGLYEVGITNAFGGTLSRQALLLINGVGVP